MRNKCCSIITLPSREVVPSLLDCVKSALISVLSVFSGGNCGGGVCLVAALSPVGQSSFSSLTDDILLPVEDLIGAAFSAAEIEELSGSNMQVNTMEGCENALHIVIKSFLKCFIKGKCCQTKSSALMLN